MINRILTNRILTNRLVIPFVALILCVEHGPLDISASELFVDTESSTSEIAEKAFAIFNRSCFECHGASRHEGDLRLDSEQAIHRGGISGQALDLQSPDQSELLRRIRLPAGHEDVMPNRGATLSVRDVQLIEQWLKLGAPWSTHGMAKTHWAYVKPDRMRTLVPAEQSPLHAIDYWVKQRLHAEGRQMAPTADLRILCRRLHFDVIGLPPSPADADRFAEEASADLPGTVSRWIDRLLESPQYGEKWARPWLDAARYADSHGFQRDDLHELWSYRDWVIRALNSDMPFDQFTIEQLAGDLLPTPTQDQLIATGFNRCSMCNVEAGTEPEENRFNQVVDRVNTLGYVWLGATLECAQCHDHKYDPFTQRDYFGLFAFFNQSEIEADRANPKVPGSIRFNGPYMNLAGTQEEQERNRLNEKILSIRSQLESQLAMSTNNHSQSVSKTLVLKPTAFNSSGGAGHQILDDGSIRLQDDPPEEDTYLITIDIERDKAGSIVGFLLETLTDPSLPGTGPGRGDAVRPNFVLNTFEAAVHVANDDARPQAISLTDARADFSQKKFDVSNAIDADPKSAWAIAPQFGRDHWATFRIQDPGVLKNGSRITFRLVQNFGGAKTIGRFRLSALTGDYEASLPTVNQEPAAIIAWRQELASLERERDKKSIPKTLVMRELSQQRHNYVYARGDFRSPTDQIEPATPQALHVLRDDGQPNRLTLARWLVSDDNPLVGRVQVNRMWTEIFGVGLVSTPEDFGLKGEPPSHPELLDSLALQYAENGWSQKKLLKFILTSQTYRQTSMASQDARDADPMNRLLGRGPRFRFPAETIRDNALAISGNLCLRPFGPPIHPPQPPGIWEKVGGQKYDYQVSPGDEQYRRGIYVVLKRMSPYPSFINFDATARLACRVNRGRSNTPLQALNLLNDPVYVESAKSLATRIRRANPDATIEEQINFAFQLAVARTPRSDELQTLQQLLHDELHELGEPATEEALDKAWFAIAVTLLNLDETITKE